MARRLKLRVKPKSSKKAQKTSKKTSSSGSDRGFVGRTSSGFKHARVLNKERREQAKKPLMPFRFYLKVDETANLIIVDEGEPFFMHEHQWQGPTGKWDQFEVCIQDKSLCPLCRIHNREGTYVMMLTVIDKRPYVNKAGKKINFNKKLLPVKPMMIPKFERLYKEHGTFRGMSVEMVRDSEKGTNIGDGITFKKMLSEKALAKYGDATIAADYETFFPMKTEQQLQDMYGGTSPAGSEDVEDDEDLKGVDMDEDDDD